MAALMARRGRGGGAARARERRPLSGGTAASTLLLGCSASAEVKKFTPPKLSADKPSGVLSEKLAAATGQQKPHVSCPENLVG
ncbi:hypothetical protein ABZ299_10930 [Streptomyces sp. NPDC006184]|uniref:hypothetical protein n=1 Tax=Streptomyces sp. NPDC006184 TaxID=3155455 RepID=UPI0033AD8AFB